MSVSVYGDSYHVARAGFHVDAPTGIARPQTARPLLVKKVIPMPFPLILFPEINLVIVHIHFLIKSFGDQFIVAMDINMEISVEL